MMLREKPVPDAGATILGHYGLANPMVGWLLSRDPSVLAETPTEFRKNNEAAVPTCCAGTPPCGNPMKYRADERGRPVWKCYFHDPPAVRRLRRKRMIDEPIGSLAAMVRAAAAGEIYDLVWDGRTWVVKALEVGERAAARRGPSAARGRRAGTPR